jgi:hypothetical protein
MLKLSTWKAAHTGGVLLCPELHSRKPVIWVFVDPKDHVISLCQEANTAKPRTKGPGKTAEKWPVSKPGVRLGFSPEPLFQRKNNLHTPY